MPDLVTAPSPPPTATVAAAIILDADFTVPDGTILYATTLPGLIGSTLAYTGDLDLYNFGVIWNANNGEAVVLQTWNWNWIHNDGLIVASSATFQAATIDVMSGFNGGIVNSGGIYAIASTYAGTIEHWSGHALIQNSGTIAARANGGARTIMAWNGGFIVNEESGSILAQADFAHAIEMYHGHWAMSGFVLPDASVVNHGLIEAQSESDEPSVAIVAENFWFESIGIDNAGTIRADIAILSTFGFATTPQDARQFVINRGSGLISGDIYLSLGNDLLTNYGQIAGDIDLGDDTDILINAGTITGTVVLGEGTDLYDGLGGIQSGTVFGGGGADLLVGTMGADTLDGGAGNDILLGGSGDTLTGGDGRDIFRFESTGNVSIEDFVSGTDVIDLRALSATNVTISGSTVSVTTASGTLTIQVAGGVSQSDLIKNGAGTAVGTNGDDALIAVAGGSTLNGGQGLDLLLGGAGADHLNGGEGPDLMVGGAGDDTYYVDTDIDAGGDGVADRVVERAGGGIDTVHSSVSFTLEANVERLVLTGDWSIDGAGNELDNIITGNFMSNNLSGGAGNDRLIGGDAGDVFRGGSGLDSFEGTLAEVNGDTILDMEHGDSIWITDASFAGFSLTYTHGYLTYTGGTIAIDAAAPGMFVAQAAAGGGVRIDFVAPAPVDDFNGDGRSDVLWRQSNGFIMDWLSQPNGGFVSNHGQASWLDSSWSVRDTGDFNGDNREDVLFRQTGGLIMDWLGQSNGSFASNYANAGWLDPAWQLVGVADFNGDHRDDLLLRHGDGLVMSWLGRTDGGFTNNYANAAWLDSSWQLLGTGDFNGDGVEDILWRQTSGLVMAWICFDNGTFSTANIVNAAWVNPSWQMIGTGDFNGDGRDDLLFRQSNGLLMNMLGHPIGSFNDNYAKHQWLNPEWQLADTGDYNNDGRDDLLWRNANGTVMTWLGQADGGYTNNYANVGWLDSNWALANSGDYDGDGREDLLFRHASGIVMNWLGQENGSFANNYANGNWIDPGWSIQNDDLL